MAKDDLELSDVISDLRALIDLYPEWLVWGTWDTPRCYICKGFQYRGGHKKGCQRQKYNRMKFRNITQETLEI
jgi:hypothetical protein